MNTTRFPLLLIALAGCSQSTERAESPYRVINTFDAGAEPVLVRSATSGFPVLHYRSDTLIWTDTTSRGDTSFLSRGRAITSVAVVTDSQWIAVALPVLSAGIPFGLFGVWNGTELQPGAELLTMTYGSETPATLLARIATARRLRPPGSPAPAGSASSW